MGSYNNILGLEPIRAWEYLGHTGGRMGGHMGIIGSELRGTTGWDKRGGTSCCISGFFSFLFFPFERQMIVAFSVGRIFPFCYSSCFTLISSQIHVIAGGGFCDSFRRS